MLLRPPLTCTNSGAKGTRTPGLLHAMQALYQLSYSPTAVASGDRQQRHASVQDLGRSTVIAENRLRECPGVVLDEAPTATAPAEHRPGAVRQRAYHVPQILGQAEQARGS
jgi:hypothetical protein